MLYAEYILYFSWPMKNPLKRHTLQVVSFRVPPRARLLCTGKCKQFPQNIMIIMMMMSRNKDFSLSPTCSICMHGGGHLVDKTSYCVIVHVLCSKIVECYRSPVLRWIKTKCLFVSSTSFCCCWWTISWSSFFPLIPSLLLSVPSLLKIFWSLFPVDMHCVINIPFHFVPAAAMLPHTP